MCGSDIKILLDIISHETSRNLMFKMNLLSLTNFINIKNDVDMSTLMNIYF